MQVQATSQTYKIWFWICNGTNNFYFSKIPLVVTVMLSLLVWDHTWLKIMVRDKNERFRSIRFVLSGVFLLYLLHLCSHLCILQMSAPLLMNFETLSNYSKLQFPYL